MVAQPVRLAASGIDYEGRWPQEKHAQSGFRSLMPPGGVKPGCQEHEQSKRDSSNGRKPGIDTCGRRQDQPQRTQAHRRIDCR
jgi:hypothetical protein